MSREVSVEFAADLSVANFHERYLAGGGRPVVVKGALESWPALSTWSFQFFKGRYPSEGVSVCAEPRLRKVMSLGRYIDYLDQPREPSPGLWVDTGTGFMAEPPSAPTSPLYLTSWNAFERHPDLLHDVGLSLPFIEDWLPMLPAALRSVIDGYTRFFSSSVLIGPEGSLSRLHYDVLCSHAYLAQIVGRKRCVLFAPTDAPYLYEGQVDPARPDLVRFPRFAKATPFECVIEPGDLLFIPSMWWHHVVGLEKSITVNHNFFNRENFCSYMASLFQALPAVVDGLESAPLLKKALGITWKSGGFVE